LYYGLWHAPPNIQINKAIKGENVDLPWLWKENVKVKTTLVSQDTQLPTKADEKQICIDIVT